MENSDGQDRQISVEREEGSCKDCRNTVPSPQRSSTAQTLCERVAHRTRPSRAVCVRFRLGALSSKLYIGVCLETGGSTDVNR